MTDPGRVQALLFDVFGTLTDWRTTVIRGGRELGARRDIDVDWEGLADAWRAGYGPAMRRVEDGELPRQSIDSLHRMILDDLLPSFGAGGLGELDREHLNRVWHRLDVWPDVHAGLQRLHERFTVAPLSNGNVSLLVELSRRADLRWDCVLSAELLGHFKPHPEVYRAAARILDLAPDRVMMVAAHNADLVAAADVGFRTAFVGRPTEHGPDQTTDLEPVPGLDIAVAGLDELADRL
jgi:2-haloacid dehalogenase